MVGFVETYNRPLAMEAVESLERGPRKRIDYQGVMLEAVDTSGVLPVIVVWPWSTSSPTPTHAPGSPHEKPWPHIEELLDAGR